MENRFVHWLHRNMPKREELEGHRLIGPFARRPELWRFTRRSVPRGVAVGLLVGIFALIPGVQIVGAALMCVPCRGNIPIAALMTFLSNPATTPFLIAASVWLGNSMFGLHANVATISIMVDEGASAGAWVRWVLSDAAPALLAGLFVISVVSAVVGYLLAALFWDNWIRLRWRRKLRRARDQRHEASTSDGTAG